MNDVNSMNAVVTIIVTLFMAGGPIVALINARAAKKPEITTEQAEDQTTEQVVKELGIDDRWQDYADELESRLGKRIERLETSLTRTRNALDATVGYAESLRGHIHKGLPPPPPPWPDNIF